jgi:hypothetical protein
LISHLGFAYEMRFVATDFCNGKRTNNSTTTTTALFDGPHDASGVRGVCLFQSRIELVDKMGEIGGVSLKQNCGLI